MTSARKGRRDGNDGIRRPQGTTNEGRRGQCQAGVIREVFMEEVAFADNVMP